MTRGRLLVIAIIATALVVFLAAGGQRYLTFENIKAQQATLSALYDAHPWQTALAFFALYVAVTGVSLPGAALLTLVAGAVFGLLWGTVLVSFAASIGATVAFLVSRLLLRDWVQQRFRRFLEPVNRGIERDGAFYLFTLRLIPQIPFFAINIVMGLTPLRARTFYWVSQLGMLAGTLVYVNAGTQLGAIQAPGDILSVELIAAFLLLGVFPLIAKKVVDGLKARRVYTGWKRPARFDRNVVVIGAGSAGLVAAYVAAAVRARVTLVEAHRMGGDCLNTGCVPSKALIRTARLLAQAKRAHEFGLRRMTAEFDFGEVMERVQRVVTTIEPHDSVERYTALGVECLAGEAKLVSPWEVEVRRADGAPLRMSTRAVIIAAGARPFVPPIPGLDRIPVLTSDNLWALRELPRRLVVLGGGPIGSELAQAFARLGAKVTQLERLPRLLAREDPEVSQALAQRFRDEGVEVLLGCTANAVVTEGGAQTLVCENASGEVRIPFDRLLCAVGRAPSTEGLGLEALGIPVTKSGTIEVNEYLRTRYPNIYACGDVAGPYQFTHTASHQAWYAAVNALLGGFGKFRVDYSVIPWATFTDPEVARVGLNETEARERNVDYEVSVYDLGELDRAIAEGEAHGFVKVLTVPKSDRILGATIVGGHAGELIGEFISAMKRRIGLNKILGTIHVYPTFSEANKYVAGVWKRAHAPQSLLRGMEHLHSWRRG